MINNTWKGKNIDDLPLKYLSNIKRYLEKHNETDIEIYKNICKTIIKKEEEQPILVYDKHNTLGYGTHYYEDKNGNIIGGR